MKYCAFLRGVNVNGTAMKMAEVCDVFKKAEKSTKIYMFFVLRQIPKSLRKAKSVEPNNTNQNNFFEK